MKRVVILLNMGGIEHISDVEIFLKNMFNDKYIVDIKSDFVRKMVANLITKMRLKNAISNYQILGGKSPIIELTRSLVGKLNIYGECKFDYAMNYTRPFAKDVLSRYLDYDEVILFPLYPHHSKTTIVSSLDSFYNAADELKFDKSKFVVIKEFYDNSDYNEMIADDIISRVKDSSQTELIFSAHSLPQKIVDNGDLYQKHVLIQIELIKNALLVRGCKFASVNVAYQSRVGFMKWLEPSLKKMLERLKGKSVVIYPISFCIDNSETDFELDIEYRAVAKKYDIYDYEVIKAPNDSQRFVDFIVKQVRENIKNR